MKTGFYCKYDLYDVSAINDSSPASDNNQGFGDLTLIKDDVEFPDYATLEEDYFILDETMPEMPDEPDDVVYFSSTASDENGEFSETPTITVAFDSNHTSSGLTFEFVGDYPLEMEITWYGAGGYKLYNETFEITDNVFSAEAQVENYRKVIISFTRANPYRYVKLRYIMYGKQIIFGYGGLPVKNASLIEECDPISNNIATNELTFDLIDEDDDYNPGNAGGAHELLQAGQGCTAYENIDDETVLLGRFFLSKYDDESNSTGFTLVDYRGLLEKNTFRSGTVYEGETAGNIIDDIMSAAGITAYTVSDDIREIPLYGWLKVQTCKNALREVLFACGAVADSARSLTLDIFAISKGTAATIKRTVKFSTKVEKEDYISSVSVTYPTYTLANSTSNIVSGSYAAGTYTVDLSSPATGMEINTGMIDEQTTNYVTFTIEKDADVVITGYKYEKEEQSVVAQLDEIAAGQTNAQKSFSGTLMDASLALAAAKRILNYYSLQLGIEIKYLNSGEKTSEWLTVQNANKLHSGFIAGVEKMTTELTGGFVTTAQLRGYYELSTSYYYAGDEIYAGDDIGVI